MAAIVAADILWKYSIKTGAAGNSTASAQATSLGKYISTTVLATAGGNEWFDDVSGAENAASTVDYRCMFIHNSNGANAYQNAGIYLCRDRRRHGDRHRHRQHRGLRDRVGVRAGRGDRQRDHGPHRGVRVLEPHHGRRGTLPRVHPHRPVQGVLGAAYGREHGRPVRRRHPHHVR
jgi:hypothetical protein